MVFGNTYIAIYTIALLHSKIYCLMSSQLKIKYFVHPNSHQNTVVWIGKYFSICCRRYESHQMRTLRACCSIDGAKTYFSETMVSNAISWVLKQNHYYPKFRKWGAFWRPAALSLHIILIVSFYAYQSALAALGRCHFREMHWRYTVSPSGGIWSKSIPKNNNSFFGYSPLSSNKIDESTKKGQQTTVICPLSPFSSWGDGMLPDIVDMSFSSGGCTGVVTPFGNKLSCVDFFLPTAKMNERKCRVPR